MEILEEMKPQKLWSLKCFWRPGHEVRTGAGVWYGAGPEVGDASVLVTESGAESGAIETGVGTEGFAGVS